MKIKITLLLVSVVSLLQITTAQVGINTTTPDSSAELDIESETKGLLIPRMTSVLRLAITNPADGLLVFDTDLKNFFFWNEAENAWFSLNPWTYQGPDGNGDVYDINTMLTTNVGIGTLSPQEKLHVAGNARVDGNLDVRQNIDADGNITAAAISGNGANISNVDAVTLGNHAASYFGTSADVQALQTNKADRTELYTGQNTVTVGGSTYAGIAPTIVNSNVIYTRMGNMIFLQGSITLDNNRVGRYFSVKLSNLPDFPKLSTYAHRLATAAQVYVHANSTLYSIGGITYILNHLSHGNVMVLTRTEVANFEQSRFTINFQIFYPFQE